MDPKNFPTMRAEINRQMDRYADRRRGTERVYRLRERAVEMPHWLRVWDVRNKGLGDGCGKTFRVLL